MEMLSESTGFKIQTECISYANDKTHFEGFLAYQDQKKQPAVILCHAWGGRDDFICEKAQMIAKWGYVGFALDMYGKGILGRSKEQNAALKQPLVNDRKLLQDRVVKAWQVVSELPYVDVDRIAVLGFGFGGICALDLARSGADIKGAISIYGHFEPPPPHLIQSIKAKILILHGYCDPIVPLKEFTDFAKEMEDAHVDWQAHLFGQSMHAFATPSANDFEAGILYNPVSAKRSNRLIYNFLDEIFH
jgi:dienelactone hydrolase